MAARKATAKAAPVVNLNPFVELGRTGLKQSFGYIYDEFLNELKSSVSRNKLYREIRDNSPAIGAAFRAIDNVLRDVKITVAPGGDAPEDMRCWELIDSAFSDLNAPWSSVLSQAGSMKAFGWAALEPVYKQRQGDQPKPMKMADGTTRPGATSAYADGLYGWRKFAPRSQESLLHWDFALDSDDVTGLTQIPAPKFQPITIPVDKLILFKIDDDKGSPEGRSLLRNCVMPWKFVKRIEEIEGIGIERDLAGLPVLYAPSDVLSPTAAGNELAVQNYLKKLVTNIRRDAQEGVLLPGVTDANGKRQYELTLLSTGGTRQFDTNTIVQRYEHRLLMNFLADFLQLGLKASGSYALSKDKTDLFNQSLGVYLDEILEPFNQFEIPRLLSMNGMRGRPPALKHGSIGARDLSILGPYLASLAQAGVLLPSTDGQLEATLLEAADLPVPKETIATDAKVGNT